ncbi:hypothetical protein B0H14DRAFT_126696 [Mycena olivaceomarginata]|nr:hypothetical protein B0H14DRAFT_126696 [Mycena olivaceomarginata]
MPPRISAFVPSATPLQLAACYDIADLFVFLDVCKPPHQFARLVADGADAERLEIFSKYLAKKTQAGMMPTLWDGRLNGVLLFVSPSSRPLLEYLKTPPELCSNTALVVILLYTQDPPPIDQHYKRLDLLPLQRTVEPAVLSPEQWRKSLLTERDYHVSLRIIQVPPAMRKYAYNHTSTVWSKCTSEGDDHRAGQDTRHLCRVLKKSKVGVVPATDSSADIVFIHVGALQNVHNLPHLARRRLRPEVRFCLYGSHETVPPSLWGFREIYLLGGVVTFTPEALVNDTWSVFKTIRNLHAHPLWVCYLLPQVVGMAVKLSQLREDEMPEYADVLPHLLNKIVTAVQKGEVGLMTTPSCHPTDDECGQWVLDNALLRPRTTETILNHCLKEFEDNYASHPQDTWSMLAKNDILADVRRLQIQPAALNNYRRFVILDSCVELRYHLSDGIEWNTAGTFDFHDDFVKALEKLSIA